MKFIPKSKKFLKIFKFRFNKKKMTTNKTINLKYGKYGLKALSSGSLNVKHFELLRLRLKQGFKRKGKIFFRKLPYIFTSKKPSEVRMGKGKGNHFEWICPIFKGQIFIEFIPPKEYKMYNLLKLVRKCKKRLPLKCVLLYEEKFFSNNLEKFYLKNLLL